MRITLPKCVALGAWRSAALKAGGLRPPAEIYRPPGEELATLQNTLHVKYWDIGNDQNHPVAAKRL